MSDQNFYRIFDDMCWPAMCLRAEDVAHSLTWSESPSKIDRLLAASVLSAYYTLIAMPEKRRNAIIRELRKGPGIVRAAAEIGRNTAKGDGGGA